METAQSDTAEVDQNPNDGKDVNPTSGGWLFPALLAIVLLVALMLAFGNRQAEPQSEASASAASWTPSEQPQGETVSLEIDFGNGAKRQFATLPWRAGMTVADLMGEAQRFRPGIRFTQLGSGASGLLISIDGLENEGSGGRNWLYKVDDRSAEASFSLETLEPGMSVLWEFTTGE